MAWSGAGRFCFGAGELEGVRTEELSLLKGELDPSDCGASIAERREVHPIVSEYGMDLVEHGLDQGLEEVGRSIVDSHLFHLATVFGLMP